MNLKTIQHCGRVVTLFAFLSISLSEALAIGGGGGVSWDDVDKCSAGPVSGVSISAHNEVERVRFRYGDSVWAEPHGGKGIKEDSFYLPKGETIVEIRYRSGLRLDQLTFITSKGRSFGPYGGNGGAPGVDKGWPGQSLGCVSGRSGMGIDQINFSWRDTASDHVIGNRGAK